jgi:hypothetical protein
MRFEHAPPDDFILLGEVKPIDALSADQNYVFILINNQIALSTGFFPP